MKYVLVTPARNEQAFIAKTLDSMIAQTLLPERWVIVDDGSTDRTAEIVEPYAQRHPWIELVRRPKHLDRSFAGKVHAFNAGLARVQALQFDVIGNLDADLSFDPDYLNFLMKKFSEDAKLGVAGTPFIENGYDSARDSFEGQNHVAGGCQLFRCECFQEIGGYLPNRAGGVDWIAVTTARMKGWTTRTFTDIIYQQHRNMGEGASGKLVGRFKYGGKDYLVGNHPLWELFRIAYQMTQKPVVIGGLMIGAGYISSMVRGYPRPVSSDFIAFQHREQLRRLRNFFAEQYDVYKLHSSSISH